MKDELVVEFQSGQKTAKAAAAILASKKAGFLIPTASRSRISSLHLQRKAKSFTAELLMSSN